jgi:penicillin amidase
MTALTNDQRLTALGLLRSTAAFPDAAQTAGISPAEARALIDDYLVEKASLGPETSSVQITDGAEIVRDRRGVPHIHADNPADLFFALGYAQAQDRLWQLDYLRRQAHGRLSEVFGAETLESDVLSRTLDFTGIAQATLSRLHSESRDAIEAFSAGVNAWLEELPAGLPVEFELLEYEPEPWRPLDSIAILRRWWWYLTGRLNVLTTPEAVRAALGDGAKYEAFFAADGPVTYIVPPGHYDPNNPWPAQRMDPAGGRVPSGCGGSTIPAGSNNWAVAPSITRDGSALLASDPHIYFTIPADWYEVHLHGAGHDAFGACYPAIPAIMIGRNRRVAWGVTNNICSLRDLYVEQVNPNATGEYRRDDAWAPLEERTAEIAVRGANAHRHTTRYAHGRPVVDHLVPETALPKNLWRNGSGANSVLSLAWVGFEPSDEIHCWLRVQRSSNVDEAREAYRGWRCPTWNMVFADDAGAIGYQCIGAIPLRGREHHGYRRADDPHDAWQGTIPFDGLPRLHNPARGWIASANNPTAPPDFPYPLSGTWAPEDRAGRAEHLMETRQPHSLDGFADIQTDIHSGRAERGTPALVHALEPSTDPVVISASDRLRSWDYRMTTDSIAASLFYVFFWRWHQRVARERFDPALIPLAIDSGWGLSSALLHENLADWFADDVARIATIRTAFDEALAWLTERFGSNAGEWAWGRLHTLGATHPAARTPLQHELLDVPPRPHAGGASTLASAFYLPAGTFESRLGANYRLLAELGSEAETRANCWPGQSGQPGSAHYVDQVEPHLVGGYANAPLTWADVEAEATSRTRLTALK